MDVTFPSVKIRKDDSESVKVEDWWKEALGGYHYVYLQLQDKFLTLNGVLSITYVS